MLPPDYIGALQEPGLLDVVLLLARFMAFSIIGMTFNVAYLVGTIWWMLFLCRWLKIPWIDGTTRGFVNRS